jgi:hypothetical protein
MFVLGKVCPSWHIFHDGYDLESLPSQLLFLLAQNKVTKKVRPYYCSKEHINKTKSNIKATKEKASTLTI